MCANQMSETTSRIRIGIGGGGPPTAPPNSGNLGLKIRANRPRIRANFVSYLPQYMVKTARNCYKIKLCFRALRARI